MRLWDVFQLAKRGPSRLCHKSMCWVLSTLSAHLLVLSASVIPIVAQEQAADRVQALRTHLSQVQTAYSETLNESGKSKAVSARVDQLRAELREQLGHLIQKATSSDATLAVYRA